MKALLKKDFLLNQSFIWTLLLMLPLSYVINVSGMPVMVGIMLGFVIGLFYYDNQSGMHKFVVSLPITRKEVIHAKYMYSIIFMFLAFLYYYFVDQIAHMVLNYLDHEPLTFTSWFMFYLITLMVITFYIPFYVKFTFMFAFIFQIISMVIGPVVLAGFVIWLDVKTNILDYINSFIMIIKNRPFLVMIPSTIVVIFISWFISLRIFLKKDLT